MEIIEKRRKSPKRIVFNISEEDHELVKKIATTKRMSISLWIMKAMNEAIKRDIEDAEIRI